MTDKTLSERVDDLVSQHVGGGDVSGWFEKLYEQADGDMGQVPWAAGEPNMWLMRWLLEQQRAPEVSADGYRGSAVVSGCGLGDDAEALAAAGYDVVAFDVAETCVRWCKKRFPNSRVHYEVADLFAPPLRYQGSFDLVYDCYTVQSLPLEVRPQVLQKLVGLAAPHGRLLLIAFARSDGGTPTGPPWPLSRLELEVLEESGLRLNRFEDFVHQAVPKRGERSIRRFVAEYQLAGAAMQAPPSMSHWYLDD